ncbi:GntR family transcriptional regulator [Pseudalkalibacillus salsuginis]|uniref:GntR family transcriptional regulator n=1 Tax=Pseudalkalibacillus salsuginis TaxID=2910972 RepID=UPI001F20EBEB|nr:GntR family transcriptional regulator [Pseudalkalibacillus salsuginis]MCF6409619.1 GntR family transcriptional regulator [Pseudalkalibacillus salsuginis]
MQHNSRKPLYLQIHEYYKSQISLEKLLEHELIPPEREIMKKFNVSRITVAKALSKLAKEGWIYRIPGKGSFVQGGIHELSKKGVTDSQVEESLLDESTEIFTKNLSHRKKMIGLIMPSMEDFFAIRLIKGVREVLADSDYYLVIMLTDNSKEKEREAIRELIRLQAVGLLIFPVDAEVYNDDILELKVRGFDFVLIDRYLPGVETNFVGSDNVDGAKLAVSHLWDLGHRNIAICSDSALPTKSVEDRIKGYMDALKEREAMIDPSLILTDFQVDYGNLDDKSPLYQFMKQQSASAYITLNARLGIHISRLAKFIGLHVPEDISILTFDDPSSGYDDFGVYTHISQSEQEMGQEAAKILVQLLNNRNKKTSDYKRKMLQSKIIVNESTALCKTFKK